MKRSFALVLFIVLAAPSALAHGGAHSPNTKDAHHLPALPTEGQPVSIHLYVLNDTKIQSVRAIYCRVERYACAPSLTLTHSSAEIFDGRIPWNSDFFRGVTQVGYKFDIRYADGTNESTPVMDYPSRPPQLPEGADVYYYYTLQPAPESPSMGILWILAAVGLVWARRKQH